MEPSKSIIGDSKIFIISLVIVIGFCLLLVGMYNRAFAVEPPPAEVSASEFWLQENVPTIKKLQAELAVLQSEKDKRVQVVETFGFSFNWDTLKVAKQEVPLP